MNRDLGLAGIAAAFWAIQVVLIRVAAKNGNPWDGFVVATFAETTVSVVAVAIWGWPQLTWPAWKAAYISELAGIAGLLVVFFALEHKLVGPVSAIVASHHALAALIAWAMLGETLTVIQVAGIGMTIAGVWLVTGN